MTDYTNENMKTRVLDVMAALWRQNSTHYDSGGDREGKTTKALDAFALIFAPVLYTQEEIDLGLTEQQLRRCFLYGLKNTVNSYIDNDQFEKFGKEIDGAE